MTQMEANIIKFPSYQDLILDTLWYFHYLKVLSAFICVYFILRHLRSKQAPAAPSEIYR